MVIITTEAGLKKAVNNKEEEILIEGDLANTLSESLNSEDYDIDKILSSKLFKITPKVLSFYKCSAEVNALVSILSNYDIVENNQNKNLFKIKLKKN
ncbi:hypothetical protein [Peptoniphilus stercorisuis]|uniref:Uncharacterized protein n=1 Tax=Peptoniphilus stercorisuis TaxID=1436965 RepID=A0ABS4KD93_9FIRM|nr:hypothetical protein [Peptoniphilus stercorisuis]MBP2025749.1 hypothetical protein [Peptoniphilus stercorisuis]